MRGHFSSVVPLLHCPGALPAQLPPVLTVPRLRDLRDKALGRAPRACWCSPGRAPGAVGSCRHGSRCALPAPGRGRSGSAGASPHTEPVSEGEIRPHPEMCQRRARCGRVRQVRSSCRGRQRGLLRSPGCGEPCGTWDCAGLRCLRSERLSRLESTWPVVSARGPPVQGRTSTTSTR